MPYCPYTDQDVLDTDTSPEHIVPLSLGGANGFEIPVHSKTNSEIGSTIDAALANDFLILMRRSRYDVRGHSGKEPLVQSKRSKGADGLPLQVTLHPHTGIQVWSPRDKSYVTDQRAANLELRFDMKLDTAKKFVAKVALSAGYFVYGDLFRQHVKHSDLREVMNYEPSDGRDYKENEARIDDRFSESTNEDVRIFRGLCQASEPSSVVGFVHAEDRFGVFVGILGEYLGMIHVPANMAEFPKDGHHTMGHFIHLQSSGVFRGSMKRAMESFVAWEETLKTKEPSSESTA